MKHTQEESVITRITGLSDAVFAVAITLLILDIHLPSVAQSVSTADFITALQPLVPKVLAFALSFFVIGRYWIANVRFFQYSRTILEEEKPRMLIYTVFWLFFIVLLPFSTSLFSTYPNQEVALMLYAGNIAAAGLIQYSMWIHVTHDYAEKATPYEGRLLFYQSLRLLVTPAVFLLSIPIALYSIHGAEYFWILIIFVRTQITKLQKGL